MSSNENSNELPFGSGSDTGSEPDFFSTITSESEGSENPFGDLRSSEEGSDSPFGMLEDAGSPFGSTESSDSPFGDLDPGAASAFGEMPPSEDQESPQEIPLTKKGKKSKPPKFKKEKIRRVKPEKVPWVAGDYLLILVGFFIFGFVLTVDVFAFLWYAMEAVPYMITFSTLGFFLLLIPLMLWRKRVYGDRINIFDVFLALALALTIIGSMILLSVQSVKYGTNIKGKLSFNQPAMIFQIESREGIYI